MAPRSRVSNYRPARRLSKGLALLNFALTSGFVRWAQQRGTLGPVLQCTRRGAGGVPPAPPLVQMTRLLFTHSYG